MKAVVTCACIIAICLACNSFAEKKSEPTSIEKAVVIGHLQTRDKLVTVSTGREGTAYTVKTKDGRMLDANLSEESFQAKYPFLFDQIKDGRAGNDAGLRMPDTGLYQIMDRK